MALVLEVRLVEVNVEEVDGDLGPRLGLDGVGADGLTLTGQRIVGRGDL